MATDGTHKHKTEPHLKRCSPEGIPRVDRRQQCLNKLATASAEPLACLMRITMVSFHARSKQAELEGSVCGEFQLLDRLRHIHEFHVVQLSNRPANVGCQRQQLLASHEFGTAPV